MSETTSAEFASPVILGANGDIGRTALQQLHAEGIAPAGVVLREERLQDRASRDQTAEMIASNYTADGTDRVLEDVRLEGSTLWVNGSEIPVFTPESQHEILNGNPVIDATGKHKKRSLLEPMLEAGASYVVITSPIHADEDVPAIVYGVNGDDEAFDAAAQEGLLSTSSCTTTAVSTLLGPIVADRDIPLQGALVDVVHARTKSNQPGDINNNFLPSSSGAQREIPKILGLEPDSMVFSLSCTRGDVACGSLARVTLLLKQEYPAYFSTHNPVNLAREIIRKPLKDGESSHAIEDIKDVRQIVGRTESAVISLRDLGLQPFAGELGHVVTGILVGYDNVAGYTRSTLDSFKAMQTRVVPEVETGEIEDIDPEDAGELAPVG